MRASSSARPRVAYFTPLPPEKTGVANYAAELLSLLVREFELEAFTDQRRVDRSRLPEDLEVFHGYRFEGRLGEIDAVLYQMGNSSAHRLIFETLLHYPGVVQLHDLVLHHFYLDYYYHRGRKLDYARKVSRFEGRLGSTVARGVKHDLGGSYSYFELAMRREIVSRSIGVIVHGHRGRRVLRAEFPSLPILRIEHPCFPPPAGAGKGETFRRRRDIPAGAFVIGSIGLLTGSKRVEQVLDALREVAAKLPDWRYLVVGNLSPTVGLHEMAAERGLSDRLVVTGYVSDAELWDGIAASDVIVNLRYPSAGEASGPLLQSFAMERPALVSDYGPLLDLPDGTCVKIPLGSGEVAAIGEAILSLAGDPERRSRIVARAAAFARREASPERAARAIGSFVRALLPLATRRLREAQGRSAAIRRRAAERVIRRAGGLTDAERGLATGANWLAP